MAGKKKKKAKKQEDEAILDVLEGRKLSEQSAVTGRFVCGGCVCGGCVCGGGVCVFWRGGSILNRVQSQVGL